MIFNHLGLILSERLYEMNFDTLEIIIKWLQVSVSEHIRQTPKLKIQFISRDLVDLVPSDRATCTIASMVNLDTKKALPLYSLLTSKFHQQIIQILIISFASSGQIRFFVRIRSRVLMVSTMNWW
jgi:hypothetical protein